VHILSEDTILHRITHKRTCHISSRSQVRQDHPRHSHGKTRYAYLGSNQLRVSCGIGTLQPAVLSWPHQRSFSWTSCDPSSRGHGDKRRRWVSQHRMRFVWRIILLYSHRSARYTWCCCPQQLDTEAHTTDAIQWCSLCKGIDKNTQGERSRASLQAASVYFQMTKGNSGTRFNDHIRHR